jgi:hypothetical protein
MPLDDLRAALDDLATEVRGSHDDAFPAVQDRGRRRRRRRNGLITSATTAALVAILSAGIALAGHHQTPHDIATGPPSTLESTSTSTSTSTSPTTAAVCTEADLRTYGPLPMPVPTRITATRVYESGMERLDPPPAGAQPRVSASAVWAQRHGSGYRVATYEIVLTSYSAFAPSTGGVPENWHRLMWVVIGHHVPSVQRGGPFAGSGATTVPQPACFFATGLTLFDANSGQELESMIFG